MNYILETYEALDPVDFVNMVEEDITGKKYTPVSITADYDNIRKIHVLYVMYSYSA